MAALNRRWLSLAAAAILPMPPAAADEAAVAGGADAAAIVGEGHRRARTLGLIAGSAAAVLAYGRRNWWQDGFDSRFKTIDEGWFGQHTYAGGADKLGHAYFTYLGARLLKPAFVWAGHPPEAATWLGVGTALGMLTAVEVIDAYSRRWRFSREDALMNAAGAGLAWLFESRPELDRLLDLRLRYRPSSGHWRGGFDPVGDYSGQTYLLVAKASGIAALGRHPTLRCLEFAVGYGSRGYEPPAAEKSRHVFVGISLNLTELLRRAAWHGDARPGRAQRATETLLEYVQVPGTAALADHRLPR